MRSARAVCISAFLAAAVVASAQVNVAEIRAISPGVVYNAGLPDLAAAFTKETGTGQALVRGEGDMALQAICEILPYKEIELVGPLPRELAAWIDMSTAVSARSTQLDQSLAFIRYITRPEATAIWKAKRLDRF